MNIKHNKKVVVEKGVQLFWVEGYNNLGVEQICKSTGMTKGAFYNAFQSKENFLIKAIKTYTKNSIQIMTEIADNKNLSAKEKLIIIYSSILNLQLDNNYCGCLLVNTMSELGFGNERVRNITSLEYEKIIEIIQDLVVQAQKEKDINEKFTSKQISELLQTTFSGILARIKVSKDIEQGNLLMKMLFKTLE